MTSILLEKSVVHGEFSDSVFWVYIGVRKRVDCRSYQTKRKSKIFMKAIPFRNVKLQYNACEFPFSTLFRLMNKSNFLVRIMRSINFHIFELLIKT